MKKEACLRVAQRYICALQPVGKIQQAIIQYLEKHGGHVGNITDFRGPEFRMFSFGDMESSTRALIKKGLLEEHADGVSLPGMKTAARGARLDPGTRTRINKAFKKVGLDGNGNFEKPDKGYSVAVDILSDFDIELDDLADAFQFSRDSGTQTLRLAFTNQADAFSPVSIVNTSLAISWYKRMSGNFEVLCYVA